MVKVRLCSDREYSDSCRISTGGAEKEPHLFVAEPEDYFMWNLLCPRFSNDAGHAPFRDDESIRLLKDSYGIVFPDDNDWYSVICEDTRMNIACLNRDIKFALSAIDRSRSGQYTWCHGCERKVWKALAGLSMDVFVAVRVSELGIHGIWFDGADYEILNYPCNGRCVEVSVIDDTVCDGNDDFYEMVFSDRANSPASSLTQGKDGRYCLGYTDLAYAFQYFWKNDLNGILRYIEARYRDRKVLESIGSTYDIFGFGMLLNHNGASIRSLAYLNLLHGLNPNDSGYEDSVRELQKTDAYKEYLYFRDTFRIINHVTHVPETLSRKLPMLYVNKKDDGGYTVYGELTGKYPRFHELVGEAVSSRCVGIERFILVVDVDELLDSAEDIDHAVCGFRVLRDSVEIFGRHDAVRMFSARLKEAMDSGQCIVDDDFY